ncbi:Protein of unknown function, partial [Gryllus bimaculatus]
ARKYQKGGGGSVIKRGKENEEGKGTKLPKEKKGQSTDLARVVVSVIANDVDADCCISDFSQWHIPIPLPTPRYPLLEAPPLSVEDLGIPVVTCAYWESQCECMFANSPPEHNLRDVGCLLSEQTEHLSLAIGLLPGFSREQMNSSDDLGFGYLSKTS